MAIGWLAAATFGGALLGANEGDKNRKQQNSLTGAGLELSKQQYEDYKRDILPLEIEAKKLGITAQQLATQRGQVDLDLYNDYYVPLQKEMISEATNIEPQYDRVTRDAASTVDQQFKLSKETEDRNAFQMGVRPDSGRYKGMDKGRELMKAATKSFAMNTATENERDRVDGLKFNRMATVMGRQPGASAPTQASPGTSINPNNLNAAYRNAANIAGQNSRAGWQDAGNALYAGANLYAKFKSSPTQTNGAGAAGYAVNPSSVGAAINPSQVGGSVAFEHGGLVEGEQGIDQVPASIDNEDPAKLTAGEFVIPRDVVMKKGTDFFEKMIEQFHEGAPQQPRLGLDDNSRRVH